MRPKLTGRSPIEKALARQHRARVERRYRELLSTAQIHAIQSDDPRAMVNAAGRVLYVVLGAAMAEGVSDEDPNVQALVAAVNAVHDQVDVEVIEQQVRDVVVYGLGVSVLMLEELDFETVVDSAVDLELKMTRQNVTIDDFRALVAPTVVRPPQ